MDTITITAAGTTDGEVRLSSTLEIASATTAGDLVIEGYNFAISGRNRRRVMRANSGSVLTLRNVTIRDGETNDGAGLRINGATVTIRNSSFHNNEAIAVYNGDAAIHVTDGVSNRDAEVSIIGSRFYSNRSRVSGGAMFGEDPDVTVTIDRSSFYGNRADAGGGAIRSTRATTSVSNSTFYNNRANVGAAFDLFDGTANLTHMTMVRKLVDFANDGTLRRLGGTLRVRNSIVSDSRNGAGVVRRPDCFGSLTENVDNLIEDAGCSAAFSGNPGLASSPSGSPPYYALLGGSAAIGQGSATYCAQESIDQAGRSRPSSGCDLGAVQYVAPGVSASARGDGVYATPVPIPTGYALINEGYQLWAQHGLASGVQFQRVDEAGVGNMAVIDLGVIDAIDVWGFVDQGVCVCFPKEGNIVFLDAAYSPRLVGKLTDVFLTSEGYTCVNTNSAGTIVLTRKPLWF